MNIQNSIESSNTCVMSDILIKSFEESSKRQDFQELFKAIAEGGSIDRWVGWKMLRNDVCSMKKFDEIVKKFFTQKNMPFSIIETDTDFRLVELNEVSTMEESNTKDGGEETKVVQESKKPPKGITHETQQAVQTISEILLEPIETVSLKKSFLGFVETNKSPKYHNISNKESVSISMAIVFEKESQKELFTYFKALFIDKTPIYLSEDESQELVRKFNLSEHLKTSIVQVTLKGNTFILSDRLKEEEEEEEETHQEIRKSVEREGSIFSLSSNKTIIDPKEIYEKFNFNIKSFSLGSKSLEIVFCMLESPKTDSEICGALGIPSYRITSFIADINNSIYSSGKRFGLQVKDGKKVRMLLEIDAVSSRTHTGEREIKQGEELLSEVITTTGGKDLIGEKSVDISVVKDGEGNNVGLDISNLNLSLKLKDIVTFLLIGGKGLYETAQEFGITIGTVKNYLVDINKRLISTGRIFSRLKGEIVLKETGKGKTSGTVTGILEDGNIDTDTKTYFSTEEEILKYPHLLKLKDNLGLRAGLKTILEVLCYKNLTLDMIAYECFVDESVATGYIGELSRALDTKKLPYKITKRDRLISIEPLQRDTGLTLLRVDQVVPKYEFSSGQDSSRQDTPSSEINLTPTIHPLSIGFTSARVEKIITPKEKTPAREIFKTEITFLRHRVLLNKDTFTIEINGKGIKFSEAEYDILSFLFQGENASLGWKERGMTPQIAFSLSTQLSRFGLSLIVFADYPSRKYYIKKREF